MNTALIATLQLLRDRADRPERFLHAQTLLNYVPYRQRPLVNTILARHLPPSWRRGFWDYVRVRERPAIIAVIDRALNEVRASSCEYRGLPDPEPAETLRDRAAG